VRAKGTILVAEDVRRTEELVRSCFVAAGVGVRLAADGTPAGVVPATGAGRVAIPAPS
jgi:hypothetical protein